MNHPSTERSTPASNGDHEVCRYDWAWPVSANYPTTGTCDNTVTHRPVMDNALNSHLRAAGSKDPQVQLTRVPLCDYHYPRLVEYIDAQLGTDKFCIWIAAELVTIEIGWTLSDRENDYVSYMDGWRAGARQHVVAIEVEASPDLTATELAEQVFLATNADNLEEHPEAGLILAAIEATGYRGKEAGHFSLSVGDTVTVHGVRLACMSRGWQNADSDEQNCEGMGD